jgi:hypothetical protein
MNRKARDKANYFGEVYLGQIFWDAKGVELRRTSAAVPGTDADAATCKGNIMNRETRAGDYDQLIVVAKGDPILNLVHVRKGPCTECGQTCGIYRRSPQEDVPALKCRSCWNSPVRSPVELESARTLAALRSRVLSAADAEALSGLLPEDGSGVAIPESAPDCLPEGGVTETADCVDEASAHRSMSSHQRRMIGTTVASLAVLSMLTPRRY